MATLVEHEKDPKAVKNEDCVMQRLINHQPQGRLTPIAPLSDGILRSEAIGLLFGASDPPNILAFGTFVVSQDSRLQQRLHEELRSAWPDVHGSIPSYQALRQLPFLVSHPTFCLYKPDEESLTAANHEIRR